MISAAVLDRTDTFSSDYAPGAGPFPLLEDVFDVYQANNDDVKSYRLREGVYIDSRLAMGSRLVTYEAVEASAGKTGVVTTAIPAIGLIERETLLPRDAANSDPENGYTIQSKRWQGRITTTDGSELNSIGTGRAVRVLIRALKIFGNPDNVADYDSWLSPPFQLTR
jgi:hypothetical protein